MQLMWSNDRSAYYHRQYERALRVPVADKVDKVILGIDRMGSYGFQLNLR